MARRQFRNRSPKFPMITLRISGETCDQSGMTVSRNSLSNLRVLGFWPLDSEEGRKGTTVLFNEQEYDVSLHTQSKGRKSSLHRIFTSPQLRTEMRRIFLSSYARHLEAKLRERAGEDYDELSVQSFHEFVDIEFDLEGNRMIWTPHFLVEPVHRELFSELADNTSLHLIDSAIKGKAQFGSSDWSPRQRGPPTKTPNIIYFLRDDVNRMIYVGKGGPSSGTNRIFGEHPTIPDWTHFRYDILPQDFTDKMVKAVEQMQIRVMAYLLENKPSRGKKRSHPTKFSTYSLANLDIV